MDHHLTSLLIRQLQLALWTASCLCAAALLPTISSAEDLWQWEHVGQLGGPDERSNAVVVWTGRQILVWGGGKGDDPGGDDWLNDGWRYDPATDAWAPMSDLDGPKKRRYPIGVWTGTELIIWGGNSSGGGDSLNTGARYNPATDTWQAMSEDEAPSKRGGHTMTWTGSELIVWGGRRRGGDLHKSGGRYDPLTDTWTPTTKENAPALRIGHTAVWTGTEMIIWGGTQWKFDLYNPRTDQWREGQAFDNTPLTRTGHSAIWTGSEMIIWGGRDIYQDKHLKDGSAYDPITGIWTTLPTTDAPDKRTEQASGWTGREMIIWGGSPDKISQSGGRFDLATNTWAPMPTANSPADGQFGASIWTGEAFYLFNDGLYRAYQDSLYALDGIPDDWQISHFGPENPDGVAGADPDADSTDNTMEFVAGTVPTDPLSFLQFGLSTQSMNSDLQFDLHPGLTDRHYLLEQSTGLPPLEWLPVEGEWDDLGENHWILQLPVPSARQLLYRLRVIYP